MRSVPVEDVFRYICEMDDEVGPCEIAAHFKIPHEEALRLLKKLHKDGRLGCAVGCDDCEA